MILATLYWQYPAAAPWVAAAWLLVAILVVFAYRRQMRGLAGRWQWILPAIRLLAISVIAVSILRPVIRRPKTTGEQGPVLIVLDSTVTMGIVDNTRTPAQWVAIAAATGRLPNTAKDVDVETTRADCEQLTALADEIGRARAAIDYARLAGRGLDTANTRLAQAVNDLHNGARQTAARLPASLKTKDVDRILAMLVNEPARTDHDGWLDHARERTVGVSNEIERARLAVENKLYLSDATVHDAAAALSDQTRLQVAAVAAADLVARLPPGIAVRVVSVGDSVRPMDPNRPAPVATTAVQAVCSKLATFLSTGETTPRAIVIFSDGRHLGTDLHPATPAPAPGGMPDTVPPVPVFAVDVAAPSAPRDVSIVSLNAPATVFVDEPVTVRATARASSLAGKSAEVIFTAGDQSPTTRPVTFNDDRPMTLQTEMRFSSPGPARITVDVPPLAGEASTANNHAERWIKVIGRRTRIGVFSNQPTPDQTAALAAWSGRGRELQIDDCSLQIGKAAGPDFNLPSAIINLQSPPDCIVLFDLDAASLTPEQWSAIKSAVADRGGSIVWAAGPVDHSAAIAADPVVDSLLGPAGRQRPDWIERPGGRAGYHAVIPGAEDRGTIGRFSRYLPAINSNGHRAILVESETNTPILTSRPLGRGKMLALSADGFSGDSSKLWNELLKAAVDEPYEASDDSAAIDADAVGIEPGHPVHVRVRLFGPGIPSLRVAGSDPLAREVSADHPASDGRFSFTVSDLAEGDYTLQAVVDDRPIGPSIPLHVRADPAAGLSDLSGDEYPMHRLADTNPGRFLRLDQIDTLPKRIADLPADTTHQVEQPLWDTPLLFCLVAGLFVLEWTLRKIAGLA
jgi:hypothetical protein